MLLFQIKKSFWNSWDCAGTLLKINAFASAGGAALLLYTAKALPHAPAAFSAGFYILMYFAFHIYAGTTALWAKHLNDSSLPNQYLTLAQAIKKTATNSLAFAAVSGAFAVAAAFALRYYLAQSVRHWAGLIGFAAVFWFAAAVGLSSTLFYAVKARFNGSFWVVMRRCFSIALDNPVSMLFINLSWFLGAFISLFLAALFPGPAGLAIYLDNGLQLFMRKYRYLAQNPQTNRLSIPWRTLLEEERELLGKRTLKGLFFPWKE